ncbi:flavin reductase (DIM6/NTAB) family NADH-FMN oxidoreductase RutF [Rubricella aquisinus]|uniref:Flavin reductase (DIM6/NTAB) family NADH-FMN oxidoreductase RutF n=1 Tax=Rubricella aquisinus TaxID=2028108 RepID=A0A840WKR6_9RHOB|nr:flavin reductase family protein [Rubricella aquisinus]MBB5515111.1 flavin reductase (DIM6/NTAB) family NADH-FMN oxidoreductase RutF [Rubricella aquisinus]
MTAFEPRDYRDALGTFPTGVTVVTTMTEGGPVGITANSFASLSLDPPLVMWAPARASRRFSAFVEAEQFVIHILRADQSALANAFARTGFEAFAQCDWAPGAAGPEFPVAAAMFRCSREATHPGGDHAIVVGRVQSYVHDADATPLLYHRGDYPTMR